MQLSLLLLVTLTTATTAVRLSAGRTLSDAIPQVTVPAINAAAEAAAASAASTDRISTPGPHRFAVPFTDTTYDAAVDGVWTRSSDGSLVWRLRVSAPGAIHVNLGFSSYRMPIGGSLRLSGTTDDDEDIVFTADDNKDHGELWTPVVLGSVVDLEVQLPPGVDRDALSLVLQSINSGFRGFVPSAEKSGSCNIDVVCPQGDDWEAEIKSVAVYGQGGTTFCTGTLINNALDDRTPYFLTANHCGVNSNAEARSLVVYWNYETSTCGGSPNGSLSQRQTGASFVAGWSGTDFTLLRLDSQPDPAFDVHYAGWDRTGQDMDGVVAIHHPSTDEKRISFENDPPRFVSQAFGNAGDANGPYIRVADWDLGTTEPGSSGSALFDFNHRIVGQLYGGSAACGNNLPDWYGAIRASWTGAGSSSTRLSDWLDPNNSGVTQTNTIGPSGGPIAPEPASPTPPTPTPPTPTPTGAGFCLSGETTVEVQGRREGGIMVRSMKDVQVGDAVRTCNGDFSPVYSFFHKHDALPTAYVRITTADSATPLEISSHHMLYSTDSSSGKSVIRTAQEIRVGDHIPGRVIAIESVVRNGLYAPVTQAGHLVVSGACVSSYVALWDQGPSAPLQNWATHAAMSVFRMTHHMLKTETYDAETGYATQYTALLAFIWWVQGMGVEMAVTRVGAPFLALLQVFEATVHSYSWMLLLVGVLSVALFSRSSPSKGKRNQSLFQ